ncbi:MAG TPA: nuclear transport factor 2 family protein [Marmoricola sp.]|nr:nuclear transport factor 2 family protein [Marmoricola sp.]
MTEQIEARLAALEDRLQRVEDELAITQMLAAYGPLVDAGEPEPVAALWAKDGSYSVEGWTMLTRADVHAMVTSDAPQGLIANGSCHFLGPARVQVTGDSAVAVCPSILVVHHEGRYHAYRAGANHFRLARHSSGWEITERTTLALDGSPGARELFSDSMFE